jgi:hypothetical protein
MDLHGLNRIDPSTILFSYGSIQQAMNNEIQGGSTKPSSFRAIVVTSKDSEEFLKMWRELLQEGYIFDLPIYDQSGKLIHNPFGNRAQTIPPQDWAMKSEKGGIDFNADKMILETKNEGGEIKFKMDSAMLEQLQNAPGFYPVIINIQPMTDLRKFLGLAQAADSAVT